MKRTQSLYDSTKERKEVTRDKQRKLAHVQAQWSVQADPTSKNIVVVGTTPLPSSLKTA